MSERVNLNRVPVGNNPPEPREFPLPSLRQFLTPDTTVKVKTFKASSLDGLDEDINRWVQETKNIIAVVGPVSQLPSGIDPWHVMSVTYLPATEGIEDVQA